MLLEKLNDPNIQAILEAQGHASYASRVEEKERIFTKHILIDGLRSLIEGLKDALQTLAYLIASFSTLNSFVKCLLVKRSNPLMLNLSTYSLGSITRIMDQIKELRKNVRSCIGETIYKTANVSSSYVIIQWFYNAMV